MTVLRGMTSSLEKQHALTLSAAIARWRLHRNMDRVKDRAMSTIRDVKLGYDLLGARMMYRTLRRLQRRLMRRAWNAFALHLLTCRATDRALQSTADARIGLKQKVKKLRESDKLMKQRLA